MVGEQCIGADGADTELTGARMRGARLSAATALLPAGNTIPADCGGSGFAVGGRVLVTAPTRVFGTVRDLFSSGKIQVRVDKMEPTNENDATSSATRTTAESSESSNGAVRLVDLAVCVRLCPK